MNWVIHILILIGTIGLFLYGMKTMSEALQKVAGARLRALLSTMTASPWRGILAGFVVTGLVQSSSAITVMVVGFVNAGLLSLVQSIAVIMGANVGTTVTAWLVSVLGYQIDMELMVLPLIGISFPFLFFRKSRIRAVGGALIGFSLMMLAIMIQNDLTETLTDNPTTLRFIEFSQAAGFWAPVLFVLIGAVLTALIQSSSAMIAITIILSGNGLIPFEYALALVLGENVGTTITANLAALMTNVDSRRAAFSHFLFNLFGVAWGLLLLPYLTRGLVWVVELFGGASPLYHVASQPVALALFHTLFNLFNLFLLVGFIPQIARCARWVIRSDSRSSRSQRITPSLLSTGEMTIFQVEREMSCYGRGVVDLFGGVLAYFRETNMERAGELAERVLQKRDESLRRKAEMEAFLFQIAEEEVSPQGKELVMRLFRQITDLSDLYEDCVALTTALQRKRNRHIWFPPPTRERVCEMFALAERLMRTIPPLLNVKATNEKIIKEMVQGAEELTLLLNRLQEHYLKEPQEEDMQYAAGVVFFELTGCFSRICSTVIRITEGSIGSEDLK